MITPGAEHFKERMYPKNADISVKNESLEKNSMNKGRIVLESESVGSGGYIDECKKSCRLHACAG